MAILSLSSAQQPRAYIVILNWNGLEDTSDCLNSCKAINYPNYRIVVVDNASRGDDANILAKRFPDVDLVQLDSNLGYAGGNNVGIRHALTQGADCVWLLNNDTVVCPGALNALVDEAFSSDIVGCAGSKILYFDHPDVIWFAGGFYNLKKGLVGHYGFNEKDNGQYDNLRDPDYMTGCSMLIRSDVLQRVGHLCEDFFMFFEDTEYSARLKQYGYEIRYVPSSKVWHKVSRSIVKGSGLYEYYYYRNFLWFVKLHSASMTHAVLLSLRKVVRRFFHERDMHLAYYRMKGLVDFLRGKKGVLHKV